MATLADRLNARFQHIIDQRENLLTELKKRHPELRCSWDNLYDLLQGRQDNPPLLLLEALAEVFAVDPAYFLSSRYAEDALHPPTREKLLASLDLDAEEYAALGEETPSLATKLNLVIDVARDTVTKKPFTMVSLAKRLTTNGIPSAPSYLTGLGNGSKKNPSKAIVEGLATIFRIDPAYFIASVYAWPIYVELGWLRQLQRADIQFVAARALTQGSMGTARLHQILRLLQDEFAV